MTEHHALALSGGGASGAWQAGVLAHLLGETKTDFKTVTGVSVGALNGSRLAEYRLGEEKEAAREIVADWEALKGSRDIYRKRLFGTVPSAALWALFKHKGIFKSWPVRERVRSGANGRPPLRPGLLRSSGRKFVCGAVEWGTSNYKTWDQTSPDIVDAVLASSAYPVFFESVEIAGRAYTDGGLRDITPIYAAIEAGATHITVVSCAASRLETIGAPRGLSQVQRAISIALDEVDVGDFEKADMINELVRSNSGLAAWKGWRLVELRTIRPKVGLGDSLDFSVDKNRRLLDLGYEQSVAHGWSW